jgi:hypothetical protein
LARELYERILPEGGALTGSVTKRARGYYHLACIYSQTSIGKKARRAEQQQVSPEKAKELRGKALAHLRKALELGWTDLDHISKDPDFAPIRDLPEFKALMKEWEENPKKREEK